MRTHPSRRISIFVLKTVAVLCIAAMSLNAAWVVAGSNPSLSATSPITATQEYPSMSPVPAGLEPHEQAIQPPNPAQLPKPPVVGALPEYAETNAPKGAQVCGEITADTAWTAETGTYFVTCDVHVAASVTLTIEPGVVVQFDHASDDLIISGVLQAAGAAAAPIVFRPATGTQPGSWGRVAFLAGSAGMLDHVILEYGGHEDGQLYLGSERVQVLNSVVQYSADTGIVIQAASLPGSQTSRADTHVDRGDVDPVTSPLNASRAVHRVLLPLISADTGSIIPHAGPVISNTQVLSNTGLYGGGLYNEAGSPTIQGSTFVSNTVQGHPYTEIAYGAGLYNGSGSPIIRNNTFIGNHVDRYGNGGGMYNGSGSPTIADNAFTRNVTQYQGGGLYNESGSPTIQGNRFTQNGTDRWGEGGGLYSESGSLTIINNTFDENSADAGCGGLGAGDGSVIRNNRFTYNHAGGYAHSASGGGLCAGGRAIIENNTFIGNSAPMSFWASSGGGLIIFRSGPTVRNNVISDNSGFWGAGLYNGSGGAAIQGNTFSNNWSWGGYGGGLYNNANSKNAIIENNLFIGNRAHRGGGLHNASENPIIQNNTFVSNTVLLSPHDDEDSFGGGIFTESGNPIIRNNIFAGNEAPSGGGLVSQGGSPVADYNGMWNNAGGDYVGITAGPHDLAADPLFVNAPARDFHLKAGSAMIDAGDPANFATFDFEGDPRPLGVGPDIGADEYRMAWPFDCRAVSEIPEAECHALVMLYNSTNGPAWTDVTGWLTASSPCSWQGVKCNAGHVEEIDLGVNHTVSGNLPAQLSKLTRLQLLDISYNGWLTGSIPPELGALTNLRHLYLSGNQLSGSIPPQLGNLADLQGLSLAVNQLSGSIPPQLGDLTDLEGLSLDFNQLSGSIPPELGDLAKLTGLGLALNKLSGGIPEELGNLANLSLLRLYSNQLSESIPPELGNLTNLRQLDLSENQLSGRIPTAFGNLISLWDLRVSANQLSGPLPQSLANLHLTSFYFDETALCEPADAAFQAWLAGIEALRRTGTMCN